MITNHYAREVRALGKKAHGTPPDKIYGRHTISFGYNKVYGFRASTTMVGELQVAWGQSYLEALRQLLNVIDEYEYGGLG